MGSAAAYEAIIEVNYEHWILENELDLTIEDFRCEIDVRYRRQHRQFPLWDDDMEDRLEEIADEIIDFNLRLPVERHLKEVA